MAIPENISVINTLEELRAIHGEVPAGVAAKVQSRLDRHSRNFLQRSPFLILATSSSEGNDASPRGDKPGFVEVLDDTTLLIPERPGNRLADSLTNIVSNPAAGLIIMIPGMNETLRINGRAIITDDGKLLEKVAFKGKSPTLGIIIDIEQVYFHCAKALIRSSLWNPEFHMPRGEFPTLGKILLDQITGKDSSQAEVSALDANLQKDAETNLYH